MKKVYTNLYTLWSFFINYYSTSFGFVWVPSPVAILVPLFNVIVGLKLEESLPPDSPATAYNDTISTVSDRALEGVIVIVGVVVFTKYVQ